MKASVSLTDKHFKLGSLCLHAIASTSRARIDRPYFAAPCECIEVVRRKDLTATTPNDEGMLARTN